MCSASIRHPRGRLAKLWGALVAMALLAALLAACNGGGDGENSPTTQPTVGESPVPQSTIPVATNPACQALASLDKYRYVSTVTLESPEELVPSGEGQPTPVATLTRAFTGPFYLNYSIDASLVSPDQLEAQVDAGTGAEPLSVIVIGDRHWATVGDVWQEVGPEYTVPYQPLDVCNAIFDEIDLNQAQGKKESVNDVAAQHYTLAGVPSGQSMGLIFGPESDMAILFQTMDVEVWVAEGDGWPARIDMQASGLYGDRRELKSHVRIELRDVGSDDIKIESPV